MKCAHCKEEISEGVGKEKGIWTHINTRRISCQPTDAEPEPAEANQSFQTKVRIWAQACFGENSPNKYERTFRFLEEALELVQACGASRSETIQLVNYVFSKPVGKLAQEAGGSLTTLHALCTALDLDLRQCGIDELARCWDNIEAIRAKHLSRPKDSPLPQATHLNEGEEPDPGFDLRMTPDVRSELEIILGDLNQINFTRGIVAEHSNSALSARARVRLRGILGLSLVLASIPCSNPIQIQKEIR